MRFAFVSGSPALDLVGTVESRRGEPQDLLVTPADLAQWIRACEELPDEVTADGAGLDAAVRLREAIHRLALDRMQGRPFTPADLDAVNSAAQGPVPRLELADAGLHMTGDLRSALVHVARGALVLLADRGVRLKECDGRGCTRLYVDRSRGARRTWCGMEACGNRVKAAAYRARRQQAAEQGCVPVTR